jgi:hypothetical protein
MFTLARSTITSLVVSFGLSAWFDEQKGEARSSVQRTAPTSFSPGFGPANSPALRWRRRRPGSLRSRKF